MEHNLKFKKIQAKVGRDNMSMCRLCFSGRMSDRQLDN